MLTGSKGQAAFKNINLLPGTKHLILLLSTSLLAIVFMFLHFIDIFFVIFHTSLVLFNMTGWIWKRTRKLNLITLLVTGASWSLLGLIVGTLGYCPLTDWHFKILEKLGNPVKTHSYIDYLVDRLTGWDLNPVVADKATLWLFVAALVISVYFNFRLKWRKGLRD